MKKVYRVYGTPAGVVFESECWQDVVDFQKAEGGVIYAGTKRTVKYNGVKHDLYDKKWEVLQDTYARAYA